jgi:hypothetical protein
MKHPANIHETPSQWIGSILNLALAMQKTTSSDFLGWRFGANSQFIIHGTDKQTLKFYIPDGFVSDEDNRVLLVFEIANSQTMSHVLDKVTKVWLTLPNICGVVVVKMEEMSKYKRPPSTQKPTEPFLRSEEWMKREWSPGKIVYDGHTWIGDYSSCFIVCVNQGQNFPAAATDVCS